MPTCIGRRGWVVTFAGLGINLALGVLYSWSVIAHALTNDWGWSAGKASIPYATAVGVFAVSMVVAGRAQDRVGPRIVSSIGGVLTGVGLIVASFASPERSWPMVVGFGVLTGMGIGLGYASATPPAVKWFAPQCKGLITGIVVSGFALASVYIAPTTNWLIGSVDIPRTLLYLGVVFLVVITGLSQLLVNPPAGRTFTAVTAAAGTTASRLREMDSGRMMHTRQFYLLWLMFAFSAFAGLMIIGHMTKIAAMQMPSMTVGFMLVAVLALGNGAGRILAGTASDRLGPTRTMLVVFVAQAAMMGLLAVSSTPLALVPVAAAVGFCYGANLSLFPAATAGFFGTSHLGANYGLVFTAWGVGGVFGSMTAGALVDTQGTYAAAYGIAAALCLLAAGLTFATKAPEPLAAPVSIGRQTSRAAA